MNNKVFWLLFSLVLLLGLFIRLLPTLNNNFYFTMDQGDDAVHVREILVRHQIPILGPPTGIEGLFAGPLWYYFISIGYLVFGGSPFGSVFMLIVLNLALTAVLMRVLSKKVSAGFALIVGATLQFFWPFYNASRYGFNPFPLVFLSFLAILFLTQFLAGKKKYFILAAIPISLAFHTEVAFAIALSIFYLLLGVYSIIKRHLSPFYFVYGWLVWASFFVFHLISEIQNDFSQTQTLIKEFTNKNGTFGGNKVVSVSQNFIDIIGQGVFPQLTILGFLFFCLLVFLLFSFRRKINLWASNFIALSLILIITSWLFFISNKGWQDWQTVAIPSLVFVSVLLMTFSFPRKFAWSIFGIILISQGIFFAQNYLHYLQASDDPSLLKNELEAIDWVYQKAKGQGFEAYTYLPSVYDYPYQYLYFWHGEKAYGYLPCQYLSYPGSPSLFVPGKSYYSTPSKACTNLRFLIIEPDKNTFVRDQWLVGAREGTNLIETTKVGQIAIEERTK